VEVIELVEIQHVKLIYTFEQNHDKQVFRIRNKRLTYLAVRLILVSYLDPMKVISFETIRN